MKKPEKFARAAALMFFVFSLAPLAFPSRAAGQKQSAAQQKKYVVSMPETGENDLLHRQEAVKEEIIRLEALKKDVDARITRYQGLLIQVQAAIRQLDSLSGKAAAELVKVYQTMPASNTAQTLAGMDQATAVRVLLMMSPRKAAAVMAAMSPAEAASISNRILSLGKKIPIR